MKPDGATFTAFEVELLRQWFNALEDLNPRYLKFEDYAVAQKIAEALGTKVPVYDQKRRLP